GFTDNAKILARHDVQCHAANRLDVAVRVEGSALAGAIGPVDLLYLHQWHLTPRLTPGKRPLRRRPHARNAGDRLARIVGLRSSQQLGERLLLDKPPLVQDGGAVAELAE